MGARIAGVECGPASRVALDDEQFAFGRVAAAAVLQLVGHACAGERRLAPNRVTRVLGGDTRLRCRHTLLDQLVGLSLVFFQPLGKAFVGRLLDEAAHGYVAELGFRLTFELRIAQLHRDDRGDALANVFAEQVVFLLPQQVLRPGVLVDHAGECRLETLNVHATFDSGDAVGITVDALVVTGVPLDRDVERLPAVFVFVLVVRDLAEQRFFRGVEVLHEIDNAAAILVSEFLFLLGTHIFEDDLEALVEKRHRLQTLEHGARHELGALGDEHSWVRPERDGGATLATTRRSGTNLGELALRLAALGIFLLIARAVLVDLYQQALAERVDHADADTMQTTGHLVAVATELAAGMQHGEHNLGRTFALVRT